MHRGGLLNDFVLSPAKAVHGPVGDCGAGHDVTMTRTHAAGAGH